MILVGERLAGVPGALTAAVRFAAATGARLAWIPRRAGERGAVEAGALPGLLPGGRPLTDPIARDQVAAVWRVATLPSGFGRDVGQILEAIGNGALAALLVGRRRTGRPARPGPGPRGAGRGRLRGQPGAAAQRGHRPGRRGAAGGRGRREGRHLPGLGGQGPPVRGRAQARPDDHPSPAPPDGRVLDMLADAMDVHLALPDVRSARDELRTARRLGRATRPAEPRQTPAAVCRARRRARRCSPDTGCCSTRAGSSRATTRSPAPGTPSVARLSAATAAGDRRQGRRHPGGHRPGRYRDPAAADHADARPGGLAAAQLHSRRGLPGRSARFRARPSRSAPHPRR